ncbi:MAG: hypothetical protein ACLRWM_04135 [Streptococcus sp.]
MIEEVVVKYLRGKGMLFDLNNLREWGYQGVLHGNDFMKVLNALEKSLILDFLIMRELIIGFLKMQIV